MGKKISEMTEKECEALAEKYLIASGNWEKKKGFAFKTEEMNPESFDEIFFMGSTLSEAIGEFARKATWWEYSPSDGEQIFEDIFEAVDYEKENHK
jgi:hypothetical protein